MTNMAGEFIHLSLNTLSRRPVLTAMVVFLVAFGIAAFAVWRGASSKSNPHRTEFLYLVRTSADSAVTKGNRHAKTTLGNCNLVAGRRFTAGPG
jgi:hypothetical protein